MLHNRASPGSWCTRWSRYDEAGNLTTMFRKTFAGTGTQGQSHSEAAVSYDARYYSPGKHFALALADGSEATWKKAIDRYALKPAERP